MVAVRGWREGENEKLLFNDKIMFYQMKRVMEPDGNDGYINYECI